MHKYQLMVNGKPFDIEVKEVSSQFSKLEVNGTLYHVEVKQDTTDASKVCLTHSKPEPSLHTVSSTKQMPDTGHDGPGMVSAPLPGAVLEIYVKEGDRVDSRQALMKMEAMKMENDVNAPSAGTVKSIKVRVGESVKQGAALLELLPLEIDC